MTTANRIGYASNKAAKAYVARWNLAPSVTVRGTVEATDGSYLGLFCRDNGVPVVIGPRGLIMELTVAVEMGLLA